MLPPDEWKQVKDIFQAAIELPAERRRAFIEKESEGNATISSEVEELLGSHEEIGDFIAAPMFTVIKDHVFDENSQPLIGTQIGLYKIEKELGRGGMGAVYLATRTDGEFDRKVALKLIKRGFDTDDIINRFRTERQILARLDHPNIARLIDGGATEDGLPYLVMDYVEGLSLRKYAEKKMLSMEQRLGLFLQICSAVKYAHQNLIIHRDIKPSNILVTADGVPKLLDFGIAKLITPDVPDQTADKTQNRAMTPEYSAPEQILGQAVTTAADIYSLGVVLYELLTGHLPFRIRTASAEEISRIITDTSPVKPSSVCRNEGPKITVRNPNSLVRTLQGDLDNIILMAMRKEPQRRYSSVEQFADDINRYSSGRPVIAREDTLAYRAGKFFGRNKMLVGAGSGIALSLIAGIASTRRQSRIARSQRDKAEHINRFLQKMLSSADPREQGKDVKVTQILRLAADNIAREFAGEPEIVANLQTTIGLTFLSLGQFDSAEIHLEGALEIRLSIFGLEHMQSAMSLNNYGKLLQAKGDLRGADKVFRRSLAVLRRLSGGRDLELASVLGNLGYLLLLEGNYVEAKELHFEELNILRKQLGEDDPETARTLGNLANIYNSLGDKKRAEPMHRKALAITSRFYGEEHPDTALAMLHLAITIFKYNTREAESLIRRSLELRRDFYGDEHTETAWAEYYLGEVLFSKGEFETAAACAEKVLSHRGKSIPETHSIIHSTLILIGRILIKVSRPVEAEPLLRETLRLRQRTLPAQHWLIASAKSILGECLLELGRIDEASELLVKSLERLLETLGPDHEQTRFARERLKRLRAGHYPSEESQLF